ncbi:site-2 protease family protein [Nitrosopumilus sp.]|uniref:site-2 protease family protein n=1 Tax=Nitrosopumilus sp. TaxID=2024843 RepID=UPI00292EAE11|nr:site-2 protease family protein [Nitrosopumilus sp.]
MLIAWGIILGIAKGLKLESRGFSLTPYSLTYRNEQVQSVLTKILSKTKRGTRVFADVSVIAGFLMMGFVFWFLITNLPKFFIAPSEASQILPLIPGVTLVSVEPLIFFLLSIPIVLVMHEGAHGIVATLEKIKIKTGGFAILIALFAGFVEPDEEEFNKAKKISKLRVIGAGATSNVIFSFVLGAILLTNPVFALVLSDPLFASILPESFVETFYELPEGVLVLDVIENSGAEKAGIQPMDVIMSINDIPTVSAASFPVLNPGDLANVSVLRDGQVLEFELEVMPAEDNPERGLIGIMRDTGIGYKPVLNFIEWNNPHLSMFLLWLWMISFFIGIINMLPLPILDGGKFIHSIIDKKFSEKGVNSIMIAIYVVAFILLALNIGLTVSGGNYQI